MWIDGIRNPDLAGSPIIYWSIYMLVFACTFKKFSSYYMRGHNSNKKRILNKSTWLVRSVTWVSCDFNIYKIDLHTIFTWLIKECGLKSMMIHRQSKVVLS